MIRSRSAIGKRLARGVGPTRARYNNRSERSLRAQAVGRKNFLFVGSDRGGRTAATLYCFVASCKRLGGDPFAYLKDVLERLPTHSIYRLAELLPDAWLAAHPRARRKIAS